MDVRCGRPATERIKGLNDLLPVAEGWRTARVGGLHHHPHPHRHYIYDPKEISDEKK